MLLDVKVKLIVFAVVILLISITALWPAGGLAMKAGATKRDITVPELIGNPDVHDPLFARTPENSLESRVHW